MCNLINKLFNVLSGNSNSLLDNLETEKTKEISKEIEEKVVLLKLLDKNSNQVVDIKESKCNGT